MTGGRCPHKVTCWLLKRKDKEGTEKSVVMGPKERSQAYPKINSHPVKAKRKSGTGNKVPSKVTGTRGQNLWQCSGSPFPTRTWNGGVGWIGKLSKEATYS